MFSRIRSWITYANVTATLALFLALGGTSYALIVNGALVQDESLTGADIKNNTLTGADILESSLGPVPAAGLAGFAQSAAAAQNADTLDNLDSTAFLSGYEVVAGAPEERTTDAAFSATTDCPVGKRAVGGFFRADRIHPSGFFVTSVYVQWAGVINGSRYTVRAEFKEPLGANERNRLTADAVCVAGGS